MKRSTILPFLLLLFSIHIFAQEAATDEAEFTLTDEQYQELYRQYVDSMEQTMNWMTGETDIQNGLAKINLPEGYRLLGPEDATTVLVDVWGNPPSQDGEPLSLGMLFPPDAGLELNDAYAINISYSEDGYIDDSDAQDIDYDDLLETIQDETKEANKLRKEIGYETIDIVGWASEPFYDSENKKLHWAKEVKFGESEMNTLNYNIRVLGRRGYLNLNAISDITVLPKVKNDINEVLAAVNFTDGNRYADFDSNIDKVAAIGIGGLIAGKVLSKGGFLVLLAKFWKFIVIGVIAFFAGIRRFFTGEKEEPTPPTGNLES